MIIFGSILAQNELKDLNDVSHVTQSLTGLSPVFFKPIRIVKKSDFLTIRDLRKKVHIVNNENLRYEVRKFASELPLRIPDFRPGSA